MTARGGTNIHDALLEALRQPPTDGTLPIVLFMTDGLPTVGQTSEAVIRELARKGNPHQRRIFTFGVGVDVNTPLLEKVAYESRATTAFILPGEDVEVKVAAVFRRLQGPVLADPVLDDQRERLASPRPGADPGIDSPTFSRATRSSCLASIPAIEPLEFSLRGNYRGTPRVFQFHLPFDQATTRNGFVPRLWASRKIGLLVDEIREQGGAPGVVSLEAKANSNPATRELVDEIVRLSTEFGILTEYTAFLAREGTDFSQKDRVLSEAENLFRGRAIQTRSGLSSVNQDLNNQYQKSISCVNPRNKYLGRDDERGRDRDRSASLRPGFLQAARPMGRQPAGDERGRRAPREGHHVRLRRVPRSGSQAGARGTSGQHRAPRRHPHARRRPARPGQGARRSTVILVV